MMNLVKLDNKNINVDGLNENENNLIAQVWQVNIF